jgi:hypothetical protein
VRVLLDEQIDWRMQRLFPEPFDVSTVLGLGWGGVRNGALLRRATEAGYGALVTMDRGIEHQQNVRAFPFGIVVLRARSNRLADTAPLVPGIVEVLGRIRPGEVAHVPARVV